MFQSPMIVTNGNKSRLIEEVRSRLSKVQRVFALTGSDLSAGGGTPAFSAATPLPFFEDPVAVWRWYDKHREQLVKVKPNAAHRALAALEKRTKNFTLATESIDGLHRLAGSKSVLELRGNIWVVRCTRCGMRSMNREIPIPNPPSCPICTGLVRPDIVWRGERAFVLLNAYPYNNGHLMVAPYAHIGELEQLPTETLTEVMGLCQDAIRALKKEFNPEGINVGLNLGSAAGAGVKDHLHVHVVPRWLGDTNFMPVLADVRVIPQSLDHAHALLSRAFVALKTGAHGASAAEAAPPAENAGPGGAAD